MWKIKKENLVKKLFICQQQKEDLRHTTELHGARLKG
jgi:hypothetical protein